MATPLSLPPSSNTVKVRMFDTTTNMVARAEYFVDPILRGHEGFNFTTVGFLIENENLGKKAVFDLGSKKDFWSFPPAVKDRLARILIGLKVDKNADEVLKEAGVDLKTIDSLIWSHAHWDHVGDASLFPTSAEIVVGLGFTKAFLPPFPENPNARHEAAFFKDRKLREIKFNSELKLGEFEAHDFFGDGSFYLLDAPGHCIGHMCGLARTTSDTFILMGGDICHFAGYIRPSKMSPLPDPITSVTPLDSYFPSPCPCSIFEDVHPARDQIRTQPFYSITRNEHSSYADREQAVEDQRKLLVFDASPDVLVCLAHDPTTLKVLPVLNDRAGEDINKWKAQGWKEQCQWGFLNELPREGKRGRKLLVEGLWRDGKLYNIEKQD